jgi:hypothetical protein
LESIAAGKERKGIHTESWWGNVHLEDLEENDNIKMDIRQTGL